MKHSLQEREEAALGMAYALKRLKHSMAMIAAANEEPKSRTQIHDMSYSQYDLPRLESGLQNSRWYRLTNFEELLGEKGKLHPGTQFGTIGLQFIAQADENDEKLLVYTRPGALQEDSGLIFLHGDSGPKNMYELTLDYILDTLEQKFEEYRLDRHLPNQPPPTWQWDSERHEYYFWNAETKCSIFASGSVIPEATWIWDEPRNDHYMWSAVDSCYIYGSGMVLNKDFQEVSRSQARAIRRRAGVT